MIFFSFSGRKGAWGRGPVLLSVRLCSAVGHKCQGLHRLFRCVNHGGGGHGQKVRKKPFRPLLSYLFCSVQTVKATVNCPVNWTPQVNCIIYFLLFRFEEDYDDYSVIMVKALADRLAEVCILSNFLIILKSVPSATFIPFVMHSYYCVVSLFSWTHERFRSEDATYTSLTQMRFAIDTVSWPRNRIKNDTVVKCLYRTTLTVFQVSLNVIGKRCTPWEVHYVSLLEPTNSRQNR